MSGTRMGFVCVHVYMDMFNRGDCGWSVDEEGKDLEPISGESRLSI